MCRVLKVHFSAFYAWLIAPDSARAKTNRRRVGLIEQSWLESGGVYGYRNITSDMRDLGELCSRNRVYRLMKSEGIQADRGYKRRKSRYRGKPAHVAPNLLNRQFKTDKPNERWVTDITYGRTHEGFLYLAAVLYLFSRQIVGWSMKPRMTTDLIMDALMMAAWRRRGNCHDNAVAESFFSLLKGERIRRKIYPDREAAYSGHSDHPYWFYPIN